MLLATWFLVIVGAIAIVVTVATQVIRWWYAKPTNLLRQRRVRGRWVGRRKG